MSSPSDTQEKEKFSSIEDVFSTNHSDLVDNNRDESEQLSGINGKTDEVTDSNQSTAGHEDSEIVVENISCTRDPSQDAILADEHIERAWVDDGNDSSEEPDMLEMQRKPQEEKVQEIIVTPEDWGEGSDNGVEFLAEELALFREEERVLENAGTRMFGDREQVREQLIVAETNEDFGRGTGGVLSYESGVVTQAVFDDDDEKLLDIIKGMDSGSRVLRSRVLSRIWDAVEYNSLKCLRVLLKTYENECLQYEPVIPMRHRNLSLSWPRCDRTLEYPLHIVASRTSNSEILKYFEESEKYLENYVDRPCKDGTTPLLLAVKRKNTEVALFLIEHGAKIDARNDQDESPILCAAQNGLANVVEAMLEKCPPSEKENLLKDPCLYKEGHSILYWAVKSGDDNTVRYLLEQCKEKDSEGRPVLFEMEMKHRESGNFICNICASGNRYLYAKLCAIYKDLPSKRDNDKATPLIRAAEADDWGMVREILDSEGGQETIGFHDNKGRNVFHYAYKNHNILYELTEYCRPAIINEKDEDNNTAIYLAAEGGHEESFKHLLGYIEEARKEVELFRYPFVGYKDVRTLRIILDDWKKYNKGTYEDFKNGTGNFQPPLLGAAAMGDVEIMKFLIENGVDCKKRGFDDNTTLHFAASCNNLAAVKFLLEKFPDLIDCTNDCGQTAAGCAAEAGHVEVLRYLIHEKKARITGDWIGGNVLDCAFSNFEKKGVEEAIMEIISFCDKKENELTIQQVMENSYFGPHRLMAKLVEDVPSVAMEILDRCIEKKTALRNRRSGELRAEKRDLYNFFAIKESADGNFEAISSMIKNRRDECLAHRVVGRYLDEKLDSHQVYIWLNFFMYGTFLISLTTYIGLQAAGSYDLKSPGMQFLSIFTLFFCLLNFLKELLQAIFDCKRYFSDINNYLEWIMYICTIVYIVTPVGNRKTDHQISAGAIAVFIAWMNFIWYLKRFPRLGIYVILAKKVFLSVFYFLPLILLPIIAFSLVFLMLMSGDDGFKSFRNSILTTSVMMTGEIDFRGTFLNDDDNPFSFLRRLFLFIFILVILIVVWNTLIGLAADDADHVVTLEKLLHRIPFLRLKMPAKLFKRTFTELISQLDGDESDEDDEEKVKTEVEDRVNKLFEMQKASEEKLNNIERQLQRLLDAMNANHN